MSGGGRGVASVRNIMACGLVVTSWCVSCVQVGACNTTNIVQDFKENKALFPTSEDFRFQGDDNQFTDAEYNHRYEHFIDASSSFTVCLTDHRYCHADLL